MINVCGLTLYGDLAASTRYRLGQYVIPLRESAISVTVLPLLGNEYLREKFHNDRINKYQVLVDYAKRMSLLLTQRQFDIAFLHVELFPFLNGFIESRLLKIPYIYDFDDAFFLKYKRKLCSLLLANKFDPVVSRASYVLAGNQFLAEFARERNKNTIVVPTVVDTKRYVFRPLKEPGFFTVGWIGSPSTSVYLREVAAPLSRLSRGGPVRFVIVGGRCDPIEGVDVVHVPWSEDTEVSILNSFDVGIMPLFNDEWAKGKCAFKLIQYMACGVPVVASAVGANIDVVDDTCGFLADDEDSWVDGLERLRSDAGLRQRMGASARLRIEREYSLGRTLPIMESVMRTVAERR